MQGLLGIRHWWDRFWIYNTNETNVSRLNNRTIKLPINCLDQPLDLSLQKSGINATILDKVLKKTDQSNQSEFSVSDEGFDIVDFVWEKHIKLLVPCLPNFCVVCNILHQVLGWSAVGGERMCFFCDRDVFWEFLNLFAKRLKDGTEFYFWGYRVGRQQRRLGHRVRHVNFVVKRIVKWKGVGLQRSLCGKITSKRLW